MPQEQLLNSTWSDAVSNDPKHRPQVMDWPSTTVRKEWCRRPQEAHVVDGKKIRLTSEMDPANLKWNELEADVVVESTGLFLED